MKLVCSDVVKRYSLGEREITALDGISCEVRSGEIMVVVGRSGSGKTTLLNILGGLEQPTSGTVHADGETLYDRSDRALSRYRNTHVGFVFQSFHLNAVETALENVLVPFLFSSDAPSDARQRALTALATVGLEAQADQPAGTLSAGQRQRVAIARAIVNDPEFVLADEPTGNLDDETGAQVIDRLRSLAREHERGLVLVTHDAAITAIADRILRLEDGRFAR